METRAITRHAERGLIQGANLDGTSPEAVQSVVDGTALTIAASGTYMYRIQAGADLMTGKLVLLN